MLSETNMSLAKKYLLRLALFAMFLGAINPAANGQSAPTHTVEWNTEDLPDGQIRVEVRNTSAVPVTAIVVEGQRSVIGKSFVLHSVKFLDSAVSPFNDKPMEPDQTHSFMFFGSQSPREQLRLRTVTVQAALFKDGGTWGDQSWINTLTTRRERLYRFESDVMKALMDGKTHSSSAANIIQKIDQLKDEYLQGPHSEADLIVIGNLAKDVHSSFESQVPQATPLNLVESLPSQQDPRLDLAINTMMARMRAMEAEKIH